MSFINGNSKKHIININSNIKEDKKKPLTQRPYFQKLFLNKYNYDNYSNNIQNIKGHKKITSKYNTLKNSRKLIYFIKI